MMNSPPRRPVIMLAQTPPPFHGQAVMTQVLKEALQEEFEVHHVRMDFSATIAENKTVRFSKVWKLFSCLWKTVCLLRQHPGAVLYYPPAPGHWVPVLRDLVLLSVCRPLAGTTVFHFHAHGLGVFLKKHRWLSKVWKNPEHAIVLGPSVRGDAEQVGANEIHEVPYGIDVPEYTDTVSGSRVPVIFFAGFHTASKGIFDLLETARILKERGVEFVMHTAGEWADASTRDTFQEFCDKHGLADQVMSLGRLEGETLWNEYRNADVFFFPTFFEHETFGVVIVEAMAHGLPVVSTCWPGPLDVVEDGTSGLLCDPHDCSGFADALQKLLQDEALRHEMGGASKQLYLGKYTRKQYAKTLKSLFETTCGQ